MDWAMKTKGYNQRRACALAGIDPRVYRRRSKRPADTELRTRMKELAADFPTMQWVILAYLLGLTVLMVSMGRVADLIGKKVVFTTDPLSRNRLLELRLPSDQRTVPPLDDPPGRGRPDHDHRSFDRSRRRRAL